MYSEGMYYFFQDRKIKCSILAEWSVTAFDWRDFSY